MCIEYAQILSTAKRVLDGSLRLFPNPKTNKLRKVYILNVDEGEFIIYQATHINHPVSKWVRSGRGNYDLLYKHWKAVLSEYTFRYEKTHASTRMMPYLMWAPSNIPKISPFEPPSCMPEDCKISSSAITNYRTYYREHKLHIANWKKRNVPYWFV